MTADARKAAARKVSSETVRFNVAMEDKMKDVGIVAVKSLNDQDLLAEVALEAEAWDIYSFLASPHCLTFSRTATLGCPG